LINHIEARITCSRGLLTLVLKSEAFVDDVDFFVEENCDVKTVMLSLEWYEKNFVIGTRKISEMFQFTKSTNAIWTTSLEKQS